MTVIAHDVGSVGGMEHQISELINGLLRLGHNVTVIARKFVPTEQDVGGSAPGVVEFHRVRGPARPVLLAYPWFMVMAWFVVRRRRRGIVQATGAIVPNRVDVIAVHYCHQVSPASPSRSSALYRVHSWLVGRMLRLGERACFQVNRSAEFVCVSEGVADDVRAHHPRVAERVVTIQNGVDTDKFAPGVRAADARALRASLGIGPSRPLAVFVGSDWERKGLELVLHALASAREWDLAIAGAGDRGRYEALAASLGLERSVHWLGLVSDVQPVYEMAQAFVFPSSYEAFSLVSLEAAACGLPILATPINGVRELIVDGESGFVIDRDAGEIADRLMRLAADPKLMASIGGAAREAALAFGWERMVARHHELYAALADAKTGAGAPRSG